MKSLAQDVYGMNLASSGKLKLRAKALLAEGTAETIFQACVLLHEAARVQQLAVDSLPSCPAVTRLSSSAEECWCYLEGRDPPRAAEAWGQVLRSRDGVDRPTAEAIVSRVSRLFEASQQAFSRAIAQSPMVMAMREAGALMTLTPAERNKTRRELDAVLSQFPGTTSFWWMQYRLQEADERKKHAWEALSRARLLAPSNSRFLAMSLLVSTWALAPAVAEQHIAGVRGTLDRAPAEVCLMYALAEIALARKSPAEAKRHWVRAREAADFGIARATTETLSRNLKAAQLLVAELLAGREPTKEILYLAGLGELAFTTKRTANIADVLTTRLRRTTLERDREAA